MQLTKFFLMVVSLTLTVTMNAQGTNNKYPIDSTDMKVAFEQLGMQIFKFPVNIKDSSKPRINYIIEISDSGKVIYSKNFIEALKSDVPKGFTVEDMGINDLYPKLDSGSYKIRLYILHTAKDKVSIVFVNQYSTQKIEFDIDADKYGTANSRAFNYTNLTLNKPVPLVVFYMNKKNKPVLLCPGRLSPTDVQNRYDKTFIIYGMLY